jgi:hypothetical protein
MRIGPRVAILGAALFAAMCPPAVAANSLTVFVDNNQSALGASTAIAAHTETDAAFGGGHVAFKFKGADLDCAATPEADEGSDPIPPDESLPVAAGEGTADVGGQFIQLEVGNWRVCGWLVDDTGAAVAAAGSTVVAVAPYSGSLRLRLERDGALVQLTLSYSTSAPTRLYASLQRAGRECPRDPARMAKGSILLVPRDGRFIGSDGGLGRAIDARRMPPGRWRVCVWLRGEAGSVGPASKTFAVPQPRRRGARGAV